MNKTSTFLEKYALHTFLILTPLISLAIALLLPIPTIAIALLMLLVPPGVAILLTALAEGRKSVAELLKKLFQWRVSLKWYAVALALPVGIVIAASVLAFLLGWTSTIQFRVPERSMLIVNSFFVPLVAILEEFGWRGYALPRLLARRSPLASGVLVGIAWGILHIGLGMVDGRPWLPTMLFPLGSSIVLTWMFIHTRGNLAMAILYHFAIDYSPQFLLQGLTRAQNVWSQTIVLITIAVLLVMIFGVNLQRSPVKKHLLVDAG